MSVMITIRVSLSRENVRANCSAILSVEQLACGEDRCFSRVAIEGLAHPLQRVNCTLATRAELVLVLPYNDVHRRQNGIPSAEELWAGLHPDAKQARPFLNRWERHIMSCEYQG
jgi:hypothetical protein